MTVLHLLTSLQVGGAPQAVLTLARELGRQHLRVVVAGPRGPMEQAFAAAGVLVFRLPRGPMALGAVAHLIGQYDPALVHTHGKGAGLIGRLAARWCHRPAVHTYHGLHVHSRRQRAWLPLDRWLARRCTAAQVFVAEADQRRAEGLGLRAGQPSVVIPNGVDPDRLERCALDRARARAALAEPPGAFLLGTACRLDPVKRLAVLLEALPSLRPSVRLVILGEGAAKDRLWRRARSLGVHDRVSLCARAEHAASFFRAFDAYVTASASEGCPLALLEAMALGLPCLASAIEAHAEILGRGSAQLVRADPHDFAHAVAWLARSAHREALGAGNAARIRASYAAERMGQQHRDLYERVLEGAA